MAKIKIKGREYEIIYVPKFDEPLDRGEMNGDKRTISILEGMTPKETYFVMLHEIIHAIIHESRLYYMIKDDVEEALCDNIADSLLEDGFLDLALEEKKDE